MPIPTECPMCGGEIWDNRKENKKRRQEGLKERPDYACKDKDNCGWLQWPKSPQPLKSVPTRATKNQSSSSCKNLDLIPKILDKANEILDFLANEDSAKRAKEEDLDPNTGDPVDWGSGEQDV